MKKPARSESLDARKLMDRLAPHPSWGETLGLLATSYELQPDFVETDFLPTLLGLGAWDDKSWSGRIALERKLASMESATLLQDARCYASRPRSLRVEHRLATGPQGQKLHAKVLLVVHESAVRLLVGSANLTEPGHRRNREVVTSIVATEKEPGPGAVIRQALSQRPESLGHWWTPGAERMAERALAKLDEWKVPSALPGTRFAWSGGSEPLWKAFVDEWPLGRPIERMHVVSPFWSEEEGIEAPIAFFLSVLAERELLAEGAELTLITEMRRDTQGEPRPVLPHSFSGFDASRFGVRVIARAADPSVLPEEVGMRTDFAGTRALHAKIVLVEGGGAALGYVGSANFTRRGWGFLHDPARANIEAGLILFRDGEGARALRSILPVPIGEAIVLSGSGAAPFATPDPIAGEKPWPDFLRDARLAPSAEDPDRLALVLTVDAERAAGPWSVRVSESPPRLLYEGCSPVVEGRVVVPLDEAVLRALLRAQELDVQWWASDLPCAVPLNVDLEARSGLPLAPGEGPAEQLILAYYQGRITWEDLFPPPPEWLESGDDDWKPPPLTGVDTARIQSYQVREFVESLAGIREDLKGASASEASMRLALAGPVSPVALARQIGQAVREGRRSATAGGFELVELIACLLEARARPATEKLAQAWQAEVDRALAEIQRIHGALCRDHPAELGKGSSFARFERAVGAGRTSRVRP